MLDYSVRNNLQFKVTLFDSHTKPMYNLGKSCSMNQLGTTLTKNDK